MTRMFEFITKTWNPVRYCSHGCPYCWAARFPHDIEPKIHWDTLYQASHFSAGDFVFVCDLGDLFCPGVPSWQIGTVVSMATDMDCRFLFLTKNPQRYLDEKMTIPDSPSFYLGATIESDCDHVPTKAPPEDERLFTMGTVRDIYENAKRFISVEPILRFSPDFLKALIDLKPWGVAVGYDNYRHNLPEPSLAETMELIHGLEAAKIPVFRKTLRKAWWEV